jgi:hypothetical protein
MKVEQTKTYTEDIHKLCELFIKRYYSDYDGLDMLHAYSPADKSQRDNMRDTGVERRMILNCIRETEYENTDLV